MTSMQVYFDKLFTLKIAVKMSVYFVHLQVHVYKFV